MPLNPCREERDEAAAAARAICISTALRPGLGTSLEAQFTAVTTSPFSVIGS